MRAEEDLIEACLHVGTDSPAAAERLLDAVEATVRFLVENPRAGRPRGFRSPRIRDLRSFGVKGFPAYLVFYRFADEGLEIVRLVHGARDLPRLMEGASGDLEERE